jgi:hypothetical protein
VQVVHNFGAADIERGSVFALYRGDASRRGPAHAGMAGWRRVGGPGTERHGFAVVSYYFYGKLPDIHGIALAALLIKMLRCCGAESDLQLQVFHARCKGSTRRPCGGI